MLFGLFIYSIILAFLLAKVEIQIEGKDGWAEKLPTWKKKNAFINFFLCGSPLTGYHAWLFSLIFFSYHLPFLIGFPWSKALELQIIAVYIFFLIMEDFLWFILNPFYGLGKFSKDQVSWHKKWLWFIPQNYILGFCIGILLLLVSFIF